VPAAKSLRVLVVDDQHSMRGLTRHSLERMGVTQVVDVSSGEKALEALKTEKFDLIISDWNMEGISGLDLLTSIRKNPVIGKLPFIMATSESSKAQVMAAAQAGANNYVLKPFRVDDLKGKVEAVLGALS
jgi:two-component system, chemotaxis family, chemotaxis protein CheY